MNYLLPILLLLASASFGQTADELRKAMDAFDNALMGKDSVALKNLAHDKLEYGHSNTWVENKTELIADLFNGKITYETIAVEQPVKLVLHNGHGYVRYNAVLRAMVDGAEKEIYLHVLQVWVWEQGRWQLINRQSTRREA